MKTTNDFSLSFDENNLEKVYFNKYEFIYERKERKSDYNSHVVRVTPTYINFYEKINLKNDSTVRTYCIKVDNNLSYMKISETYNYSFVVKTDYNTCIQEDGEYDDISDIQFCWNTSGRSSSFAGI